MKNIKNSIFSIIRKTGSAKQFLSTAIRFLLVILVICIIYGGATQKQISNNIVRLHIVANSDSAVDQELKLKVRDAVLQHMHAKYPDGATREEASEYLKANLPLIKEIAEGVVKENGSDLEVNARYGVYPFPTKEYEGLVLPAGMYEAVRVELGSAKGQNWWCIMFTPLCVADANSLKMDAKAMNQLREGLGDSNYRLITDIAENNNIPVKIKFRIVEIVENSKIRIAEIINNLF